jgi:hypothetical protein
LQSMLVVEEDDDELSDNSNSEDLDSEISMSFLDDEDEDLEEEAKLEDVEVDKHYHPDLADLSGLSLEERTFVHLSSLGLIRKSLFPNVELVLSKDLNDENDSDPASDDELVKVIGEMCSDLSRITTSNNKRILYLETATSDSDLHYGKQVEDEHAAIIAKCHNVLRRSKERTKKAKQKKDEDLNLPW